MSGISMGGAFGGDIFQMILQAGAVVKFVLLVLVFFSVTSWAIIFMKWRVIRRANDENAYFLDLFWENTAFTKLYEESEELSFSPVAQLFRAGYMEINRFAKFQNPSGGKESDSARHSLMDVVERTLRKTAIDQSNRLERAVSFLATTGNTAPFVGLFGTVWGIMESFRGIGLTGAANLAVVAPGISEALVATAAGLAAAIPAVVAFNYFNSRVTRLKSEMDLFSADFESLIERQMIRRSITSKEGR
jgi:biopolymer transport protein TolQ